MDRNEHGQPIVGNELAASRLLGVEGEVLHPSPPTKHAASEAKSRRSVNGYLRIP